MNDNLPRITIYNSLTQKKEELVPQEGKKIRMYACGPTVYDSAHLGHARSAVSFDIIQRFLRHVGYDVTFVRNYTDIDDKIINRANELGIPSEEVSERYIKEYKQDMASIGVQTPDVEPKVTEHIDKIIDIIKKIIDKGHAYVSENDVFFSVRKFKEYGKLSKRSTDNMLEGVRIDVNEKKEDPLDFALWKGAKEGEPSWPSPWGKGRPGWHIECSAMSMEYLGDSFEIHGGGKDLIFPHHENEIAQSESASGKQFAKYWLHNGLIQINSEKMSKSLGNFFTVQNAVKRWSPESIRLFFLSHHYQNPADFSEQVMDDTETSLERIYTTLKRAHEIKDGSSSSGIDLELEENLKKFKNNWHRSMCDDFNTANAVGNLFELIRTINKSIDKNGWTETLGGALKEIKNFANVLGILEKTPDEYLESKRSSKKPGDLTPEEIEILIEERNNARSEKNWNRADQIRNELYEKGIVLEDKPEGTVWKVK